MAASKAFVVDVDDDAVPVADGLLVFFDDYLGGSVFDVIWHRLCWGRWVALCVAL